MFDRGGSEREREREGKDSERKGGEKRSGRREGKSNKTINTDGPVVMKCRLIW